LPSNIWSLITPFQDLGPDSSYPTSSIIYVALLKEKGQKCSSQQSSNGNNPTAHQLNKQNVLIFAQWNISQSLKETVCRHICNADEP
jgi:hypothetical protein